MEIVINRVPCASIEEFADEHDLKMVVTERPSHLAMALPRYTAHFDAAEVMTNGFLSSTYGEGDTPETAIADYAKQISEARLAVGARTSSRRNIWVPRLIPKS